MKKPREKKPSKKAYREPGERFFFTAPNDMAQRIYDGAEELGLYPSEYIRILVHRALKD